MAVVDMLRTGVLCKAGSSKSLSNLISIQLGYEIPSVLLPEIHSANVKCF